jgi:hypothetical protein
MSLAARLDAELQARSGFAGPPCCTVSLADPQGIVLEVDLAAVDRLGCALRELRLAVPALHGAGVDVLERWAQALSQRVTYLLEDLGPIEIDRQAGQVLVRSTPPHRAPDGTAYYEIRLTSDTSGRFVLRRHHAVKGQPGRTQVDFLLTHEVLLRLVQDLLDTIPVP